MTDTSHNVEVDQCRSDNIEAGTIEELTCLVAIVNESGYAVGSRAVTFNRDGDTFEWHRTEIHSANDSPGEEFITVTQEACAYVDEHFEPDVVASGIAGWDHSSE